MKYLGKQDRGTTEDVILSSLCFKGLRDQVINTFFPVNRLRTRAVISKTSAVISLALKSHCSEFRASAAVWLGPLSPLLESVLPGMWAISLGRCVDQCSYWVQDCSVDCSELQPPCS